MFYAISLVAIIIFFGIGWSFAQKEFSWAKVIVSAAVVCGPLTAIWWILELFDWPTSVLKIAYPIIILWIPWIAGNLIHQLIHLFSKSGNKNA